MNNLRRPAYSWRPVVTAGICGLIVGAPPFMYDIPSMDRWLFGLGLFLTYTSIGVLVALLPRFGPNWLFGIAVGAIYSLPGSILVAVPYPLRGDAPAYYTNFAAGGLEEFVTTMVFGIAVGWLCGMAIPQPVKENYPSEHSLA